MSEQHASEHLVWERLDTVDRLIRRADRRQRWLTLIAACGWASAIVMTIRFVWFC